MKPLLYSILMIFMLFANSCIEKIDDLSENPFEDQSLEPITLTNYTYDGWTLNVFFRRNLAIDNSVAIIRNGFVWRTINNPNQSSFVIQNFSNSSQTCFKAAFVDPNNGNLSRPGNTICID